MQNRKLEKRSHHAPYERFDASWSQNEILVPLRNPLYIENGEKTGNTAIRPKKCRGLGNEAKTRVILGDSLF